MTHDKSQNPDRVWRFALYRAGDKPPGLRAEATLRRLCKRYLEGEYVFEIVDVLDPSAELPPDVLAVPTVVRYSPEPERRVVGDLSQASKVAEWLGLTEAGLLDD